jgi:hypothetical protein
MKRFSLSWSRITFHSSFLFVALVLGFCFWYLPTLLRLDALRPQLQEVLENSFHCTAIIGNVRGQLLPSP